MNKDRTQIKEGYQKIVIPGVSEWKREEKNNKYSKKKNYEGKSWGYKKKVTDLIFAFLFFLTPCLIVTKVSVSVCCFIIFNCLNTFV